MALDRTVSVKLKADVSAYLAGLKQAEVGTTAWFRKVQSDERQLQAETRKSHASISKVGSALIGVGTVAAAGVGVAVKAFADFDQAMSRVAAATHESAANMDLLRAAAIEAGARTAFSADEAAQAEEALAKAGVATADILGGALQGAMDLAAAGTLAVGDAAEIAATAMTQFGLSGSDVPHIADLLAAGAGKAQGEVSDMATALKYVGPVAHQMGVSLEETTGVIGELAANGILADNAGTSMRGMLLALTAPSAQATDAMTKYKISVYDARGEFVGFDGVADQMHKRLGKLDNATRDAAFGQLFGNAQVTAARILYAGGADDVHKWTDNVNDAGYAQETAAKKMDNLKGDIEKLKGSLQTLFITTGESGDGFLRSATQGLEGFVNDLSRLPKPVHQAAAGLGALLGATTLLVGGGIKVTTTVNNMRTAMEGMKWSARGVGAALGIVGLGLTAGFALWQHYSQQHAEAKQVIDDLTDAIVADGYAIEATARKSKAASLEKSGQLADAAKLGINAKDLTDAFLGQDKATQKVQETLSHYTDVQVRLRDIQAGGMGQDADLIVVAGDLQKAMGGSAGATEEALASALRLKEANGELVPSVQKTAAQISDERDAFIKMNPLAKTGSELTKEFGDRQKQAASDATAHASALDDLLEKLGLLNDTEINVTEARLNFLDATRRSSKESKDAGKSLDENTDAGKTNIEWVINGIKAAEQHAAATQKKSAKTKSDTQATKDADKVYKDDLKTLQDSAGAAYIGADAVAALIKKHGEVQPEVKTIFNTPGLDPAIAKSKDYLGWLHKLPKDKQTKISAPGAKGAAAQIKSVRDYLADVERHKQQRIDIAVYRTIQTQELATRYRNVDGTAQAAGDWGGSVFADASTRRASGGFITGPGGPTSDSIPAWLSNGEYVINSAATAANRSLLDAINRGTMTSGAVASRTPTGYAAGGQVRPNGPTVTYGNVTVADPNEFFRLQERKLRDLAIMSNLTG